MKNLILIGFSASGKTTVGKILAKQLNLKFFDTDEKIEQMQNLSIFDIFQKHGESFFRECENQLLANIPKGCVVSTGGGSPKCASFNLLKQNGRVIFLKVSLATALKRLTDKQCRPLLKGKNDEQLLEFFLERERLYKEYADFTIETDNLTADEVAERICHRLFTSDD